MIANSIEPPTVATVATVATGGPPVARIAFNPATIEIQESHRPTRVSELHITAPTAKFAQQIRIFSTAAYFLIVSLLLCGIEPISQAAEPILFEEAIAPILRQNCIACHHTKKAEGGLNLESFASLSKGGDSGPTIDRTDVDKSTLLTRVSGDAETIMPPTDNTVGAKQLSEDQKAILKRWIQTGAMSKIMPTSSTYENRLLPDQIQTSYAIAVTPDGEWLAFSRGNDLIFYPIEDWSNLAASASQQLLLKDVHRDSCFAIAASPDGQRIATGSSGEVKIWRRRVARLLQTESRLEKKSTESASNTKPATASESTNEKKQLTFDGAAITQIATSKDGTEFVTLDEIRRLRLWNVKNVHLIDAHAIDQMQSANSQRLEKDVDRQKRLIDRWSTNLVELQTIAENAAKAVAELQPQEIAAKLKFDATLQSLNQSEESLRLANTAVSQKQSQLTPAKKMVEALQAAAALSKKENEELHVSSVALAFTENGKNIVSINRDYQLEVYVNRSLQRVSMPLQLASQLDTIQAVGDREVRLSSPDMEVERWSIETFWELECTLDSSMQGIMSDRVNALAFNHDGTELAIGSGIGSRTGHLAVLVLGAIQIMNLDPVSVRTKLSEPELHSDTILGLAYSPDGRSLATCSADKMTKIIDIESMKPIHNLEGHTHHVLGVAWQDDGLYLSTTSGDGTLKVWDSETGESTRTITIGKELTAISFVGNTTRVVSSVIDNTVRMHDIQSNNQILQLESAQNALYAIVVSPDGRFVVATGQEGVPRAWQIEDGKHVGEIK